MATPTKQEMDKLKQNVQLKFEQIREALCLRERLLLRQIEVIATSTQRMTRGAGATTVVGSSQKVCFLTDNEDQLLCAIRSYGKFNLDSINLALLDLCMKNEDYITPSNDHETMYKCLNAEKQAASSSTVAENEEAIVVDFSRNKSLIEKNVSHMNESIINITLAEAKELIRKAKSKRDSSTIPPLNLEELDDEQESSIAEAVSSLGAKQNSNCSKSEQTAGGSETVKKPKKQRFKPKITINNCNGTINLRNISNLTINCASEEAVRAELPYQQPHEEEMGTSSTQSPQVQETSNSTQTIGSTTVEELCSSSTGNSTPTTTTNTGGANSNYSSNASSRSQSQKHKHSSRKLADGNKNASAQGLHLDVENEDDDGVNAVQCEFYNRLLNEIKNSLKQKSTSIVDNAPYVVSSSNAAADSNCDNNSNANSSAQAPAGKRFVLKNFENLKIVLESNGCDSQGSGDESFHPVQIEQWLAEIISETDLEPMQNTDILEHSRLHNVENVITGSNGKNV